MLAGTSLPFTLTIDSMRCRQCNRCLAGGVCRGSAIQIIDREDGPFVDMARCRGCLDCMPACPFDAVVKQSAISFTA